MTGIVQPEREVIINCFVLGKNHILHISYCNHNIPHSVLLAAKAFAATACSFVYVSVHQFTLQVTCLIWQ